MKLILTIFTALFLSAVGISQAEFDAKTVLGHSIGSDFSTHDQVVDYFHALHNTYPKRTFLEPYGETNEGRLLQLIFIGSKSIIENLETIRNKHQNKDEAEEIPIVWLSYNVHGNESSGTEAAMETALVLLKDKKEWLDSVLIVIDPCLNPDGRDRYVNYYKQYASLKRNPKVLSMEHQEPWPGGRFNHYLFDLNRDWAWLTQVESKQRIKKYNQWMPHVHVDVHEQGINENYYFPPAAEPYHEIITDWQREFQEHIGENHASYFDTNNWLYFSKEIFDLLYPSYGDTYPMYNGAIGMTYEQAGSSKAGTSVVIANGDTLSLMDRVAHHVTASLSTVEVAFKHKKQLISEFQNFNKDFPYNYKSYLLSGDTYKINSLCKLLALHDIEVRNPKEGMLIKGWSYASQEKVTYKVKSNDVLVSVDQLKGPMVKVLFEPKTYLSDSLTYDITAWSLPYAFGLKAIACDAQVPFEGEFSRTLSPDIEYKDGEVFAYVCEWNSMESARFLERLLSAGVNVKYAKKTFQVDGKTYDPGTLVIARGEKTNRQFHSFIRETSEELEVNTFPCRTGYVEKGNDFGSSSYREIQAPKIGLLAGDGFSPLNTGELWHYLEQELKAGYTMIRSSDISRLQNTADIDLLMVPEGYLSDEMVSDLGKWIKKGGRLIVFGKGADNFTELFKIEVVEDEQREQDDLSERQELSSMITGAIFPCDVEKGSPIAYGYEDYFTLRQSPVHYQLVSGNTIFSLPNNVEQVSGFVGSEVIQSQGGALVVGQETYGKGSITYFIDNPLFRGFWHNGLLMVANSIYLTER